MSKYDERQVADQLSQKHDLRITNGQIQELKRFPGKGGIPAKGDVGIKSKGKIDFLTRFCGYTHMYVSSFSN